jgi:hypothetical protein
MAAWWRFTYVGKYLCQFLLCLGKHKLLLGVACRTLPAMPPMPTQDDHHESALYWSAVSLIVCERMPIHKAAKRLGVDAERLRELLKRRQAPPQLPYPPTRPMSSFAS